tara:strand:+ start:22028 stop:22549 length:522 start_codon:yes stop_codon:yes gene_type:complete
MKKAWGQFDGVWPERAANLVTTGPKWQGAKHLIGVIEPRRFEHMIDGEFCWVVFSTKKQFESYGASLDQPYMPQVGEECEFKNSRSNIPVPYQWSRGFYVGNSKRGYKIFEMTSGFINHLDECDGDLYEFRPIQTQEEIKRELLSNSLGAIFEQHEVNVSKARMSDLLDLVSE